MNKRITIAIIIVLIPILIYTISIFTSLNKNKMEQISEIKLTSSAFQNTQPIPEKYSCRGESVNPPLSISGVPKAAQSLVLIVDDPDAPSGDWVHWLLWNISPDTSLIAENSVPKDAVVGLNDYNHNKYDGPCPPRGMHKYVFKLYALDIKLSLDQNSRKGDLEKTMNGHILDQTKLSGTYSK
jgi:Raf kinase inhibitor-like YbhB/YbcL family protein